MGRLLLRSQYNNGWLDSCRKPTLVRSPDNRRWLRLDPKKMLMRNSGDSDWIENDCSKNPRFDPECEFSLIGSINCPVGIPTIELGSGNGTGSEGPIFDILEGYPPGYDLPDAGQSGFGLERDEGSIRGYSLKRPGLNYALESYDDSGITPSIGRGTWDNPNYIGSSVMGGGAQITETIFDLGQLPGYVEVLFASYDNIGISVDVYYMGQRVATTCGRVKDRSKVEFFYDPTIGEGESRVMIRVRGNESTRWTYQVMGPKASLPIFALDNTDVTQMAAIRIEEYSGTPLFPAPCHATVFPREYRTEDGKWFYEFHHYVGGVFDQNVIHEMVLDYTSWLNADKFEVYSGGIRIGSTMDPEQDLGMIKFSWRPWQFAVRVPDLMVRVTASERMYGEDIESWYYTLFCANTPGFRANPWPCATSLTSMGHSSTEDNYDMDNGVEKGVVSIKIEELTGSDYVITAFDSEMEVIASVQGNGTKFLQYICDTEIHGDTRKFITVRVDAPLGSSWTYYVGCPVPLLEVEMDDKVVPVCNDEIELVVNDANIPRGTIGKVTVQASIPVPSDTTFNFVTVDGTAKSTASYGGLGSTYALDGESEIASLVTAELGASVMLFDASYYRLSNDVHKQSRNTNFNTNNAVNSYSSLSNDGKAFVNIMRTKLGNLNNKRWLILAGYADPTASQNAEWAYNSSNFIQSMRDIYGIIVTVVPFEVTVTFETSSWHNALDPANNWDMITVADCTAYSYASGQSIASIYLANSYTSFAQLLASRINNGANLHYVFKLGTNQELIQRANFVAQELLNLMPHVKVAFRYDKTNNRTTPYYVEQHLEEVPDSPYALNVPTDEVFDADLKQAWVTYERSVPAVVDPDYTGRTGTVTIVAGQMSVDIPIETLTPAHDSVGRQFNLNISNANQGTITDPSGLVTIIANTGSSVSDFNFTKSTFRAESYNAKLGGSGDNAYISTFGCVVTLGIGYSQLGDRNHTEIEQPGKVAYLEAVGGLAANPSVRNRLGVCASYPFDPARTYEYKWEATETFNNINQGSSVARATVGSSEWSTNNRLLTIGITDGHKYSSAGNRSTWSVFAYIRDDLGNVYKSNELSVSLISVPASSRELE